MPEKISILKESGETLTSNVVSVFMIPEIGKRYIITTENAVDPHGLTVLHVSEIVDGNLQRVATDDEWSSIKTIMRAIISGNVGSYQYLPTIENIKASGQYSRDISVSASASKQMIDNYTAAEKNGNVVSGQNESSNGGPQNSVEPINQQASVTNQTVSPMAQNQVPIRPSSIFPEANPGVNSDNEVIPGIAEVPGGQNQTNQNQTIPSVANSPLPFENEIQNNAGVINNQPLPVETAQPTVVTQPVINPVVNTGPVPVVGNNSSMAVNQISNPVQQVVPMVNQAPVVEQTPIGVTPLAGPVNTGQGIVNFPANNEPAQMNSQVVEPVMPVSLNNGVQVVEPTQVVPTAQIAQEVQVPMPPLTPPQATKNFAPDASLDDVVAGAQEMFIEGVKNLVQTIQEKVYRDLYAKEAELKAREELIQQKENMLGITGMNQNMAQPVAVAQNTIQTGMNQPTSNLVGNPAPIINGPMIVSADNDK